MSMLVRTPVLATQQPYLCVVRFPPDRHDIMPNQKYTKPGPLCVKHQIVGRSIFWHGHQTCPTPAGPKQVVKRQTTRSMMQFIIASRR